MVQFWKIENELCYYNLIGIQIKHLLNQ